ncbi:MAG: hypothetical protein AB7H80_17805 [Candidatus Kapaibacterium sp.]
MKKSILYRPIPLTIVALLLALIIGGAVGCSDKLVPPTTEDSKGTLSGTIVNETGQPIPEDATIIVAWSVSSGNPDYTYVYGEGTINREKNTFSVDIQDLPAPAMNTFYDNFSFGVGYLIVVSKSQAETIFAQGRTIYGDIEEPLYGAANFSNVIYVNKDIDSLDAPGECRSSWLRTFSKGFGFGKGKKAAEFEGNCTFDGFTPAPSDEIEIILNNDPNRFAGVNWT